MDLPTGQELVATANQLAHCISRIRKARLLPCETMNNPKCQNALAKLLEDAYMYCGQLTSAAFLGFVCLDAEAAKAAEEEKKPATQDFCSKYELSVRPLEQGQISQFGKSLLEIRNQLRAVYERHMGMEIISYQNAFSMIATILNI